MSEIAQRINITSSIFKFPRGCSRRQGFTTYGILQQRRALLALHEQPGTCDPFYLGSKEMPIYWTGSDLILFA
jgi:hypothetical protein